MTFDPGQTLELRIIRRVTWERCDACGRLWSLSGLIYLPDL